MNIVAWQGSTSVVLRVSLLYVRLLQLFKILFFPLIFPGPFPPLHATIPQYKPPVIFGRVVVFRMSSDLCRWGRGETGWREGVGGGGRMCRCASVFCQYVWCSLDWRHFQDSFSANSERSDYFFNGLTLCVLPLSCSLYQNVFCPLKN